MVQVFQGLRQFLTERPLRMMKKKIYFMLKALFVLDIFNFLSSLFGYLFFKYLQYTYCATSETVNAIRQSDFSKIMRKMRKGD